MVYQRKPDRIHGLEGRSALTTTDKERATYGTLNVRPDVHAMLKAEADRHGMKIRVVAEKAIEYAFAQDFLAEVFARKEQDG